MKIIYNCGYRAILKITGTKTNKEYTFKLRHVTEVSDEDADGILQMTSSDVQWCSSHSKDIPPFMKLKAWCKAEDGRFEYGRSNPQPFDPEEYLTLFSINNEQQV